MANTVAVQVLHQGERNYIVKLIGALDTANETRTIKVDVSGLTPACTRVDVERIDYDIDSQLTVNLDWDAITPVPFMYLNGQNRACFEDAPLTNNAGTGITGDIFLATHGYVSGTQNYSIVLHCVKRGVTASAF